MIDNNNDLVTNSFEDKIAAKIENGAYLLKSDRCKFTEEVLNLILDLEQQIENLEDYISEERD